MVNRVFAVPVRVTVDYEWILPHDREHDPRANFSFRCTNFCVSPWTRDSRLRRWCFPRDSLSDVNSSRQSRSSERRGNARRKIRLAKRSGSSWFREGPYMLPPHVKRRITNWKNYVVVLYILSINYYRIILVCILRNQYPTILVSPCICKICT